MDAKNTLQIQLFLSCILLFGAMSATSNMEVGYYKCRNTCPPAEDIVRGVVQKHLSQDPALAAGLIRLFFHDCFVRGCDASVLLGKSSINPSPERLSFVNFPSLRGFEVIDEAKSLLEQQCPGVVSCADILAFAGRDAAYIAGNMRYEIPSGRLDGRISKASDAEQSLPAPFHTITELQAVFAAKGLSTDDIVILSGAHSIGRSHCSSFTSRLYPSIDPTMDPSFAASLRTQCPQTASVDGVVPQDFVTPNKLDVQYYQDVIDRKVLFFSDWSLLNSTQTLNLVNDFRTIPLHFEMKFAESMVKMGNLPMPAGSQTEIRKTCSVVN